VFILEEYTASKSFAVVREAFIKAYTDKEVPNNVVTIPAGDELSGQNTRLRQKHVGRQTVMSGETLRNFQETLKKTTHFSCYIDFTTAYKYCCT
jgi:hypothetical protein